MVQGIQGTGGSIAGGAVPATGDFAPEGGLFGYDGAELFLRELGTVIVLQGDARLLVFGRPFQTHAVLAGGKPQVDGATRLLVKFRHQLAPFVTNEQAALHVFADVETSVHAAQIRHHHVAGTGQVHVPAGVLGATHGGFRFLECFIESKLVSFGKGHLAIAADIASPA